MSEHFKKGLVGFVADDTIVSILLQKALDMVYRHRVARRVEELIDRCVSGGGGVSSGEAVRQWADQGVLHDERAPSGVITATAAATDSVLAPGAFVRERLVLDVASTVLQLATPESVLEARPVLPQSLLMAYLNKQEHFDVPRVVTRVVSEVRPSDGVTGAAEVVGGVDVQHVVDVSVYRCVGVCDGRGVV